MTLAVVVALGAASCGRDGPTTAWDVEPASAPNTPATDPPSAEPIDSGVVGDDLPADDELPAADISTEDTDWCAAWADLIALNYTDQPMPDQIAAATTWLSAMPRSNEQQLLLAAHIEGAARLEANGWDFTTDVIAYQAVLEGSFGTTLDWRMTAWPHRATCPLPNLSHPELVIGYARCLDAFAPWFEVVMASAAAESGADLKLAIETLAANDFSPACMYAFTVEHPALVNYDAFEVVDQSTIDTFDRLAEQAEADFMAVDEALE